MRFLEALRYLPARKKIGGVPRGNEKGRGPAIARRATNEDQRFLYCQPINSEMPNQKLIDIRYARAIPRRWVDFMPSFYSLSDQRVHSISSKRDCLLQAAGRLLDVCSPLARRVSPFSHQRFSQHFRAEYPRVLLLVGH